jgi:hypothetical protein
VQVHQHQLNTWLLLVVVAAVQRFLEHQTVVAVAQADIYLAHNP